MTSFSDLPRSIRLHAAVLAGGKSSRMQTDKRFLRIQGESLVDRALRLARNALHPNPKGEVLLCGDVPERESLPDAVLGLGPLSGISSALKAVSIDSREEAWLLVLPVDMPLLNEKLIQTLIAEIGHNERTSHGAIAYDGFEMPCLISINSKVQKAIDDLCLKERPSAMRSIRGLFEKIGIRKVDLPEKSKNLMLNANFPSDWAHINEETQR